MILTEYYGIKYSVLLRNSVEKFIKFFESEELRAWDYTWLEYEIFDHEYGIIQYKSLHSIKPGDLIETKEKYYIKNYLFARDKNYEALEFLNTFFNGKLVDLEVILDGTCDKPGRYKGIFISKRNIIHKQIVHKWQVEVLKEHPKIKIKYVV